MLKKIAAAGLVIAMACTVSGCFEDVIDGRHVEISNGVVYEAGENRPFTGQVTNFPENKLPFQAALNDMLVVMNRADGNSPNVLIGNSLACTISVAEGGLEGETACATPRTSTVRYRVTFKSGVMDGHAEIFDVKGEQLLVEAEVKDGLLEGDLKRYSAKTGKLVTISRSSKNRLNGKQEAFDESTGKLIYEANVIQGKYNGLMKRYAPNGTLIYNGEFVDSQKVGVHEEFDPRTGKPTARGEWANGKLNGSVKQWSSLGELTQDSIYQDGVKVSVASSQSTSKKVYDLICSQQSDFCDFEGKEVSRDDLPKYVPMGGSDNCFMELCFNDKGEVFGLNPDYYKNR